MIGREFGHGMNAKSDGSISTKSRPNLFHVVQ
jgi:hypothetical protein